MVKLWCANLPGNEFAFTNYAYVGRNTYAHLKAASGAPGEKDLRVSIRNLILNIEADVRVEEGSIALNKFHRQYAKIATKEEMEVQPYTLPRANANAAVMNVEVDLYFKDQRAEADDDKLEEETKKLFMGQVWVINQEIALQWQGSLMILRVKGIQGLDLGVNKVANGAAAAGVGGGVGGGASKAPPAPPMLQGLIDEKTEFVFTAVGDGRMTLHTKKAVSRSIFRPDFNFEELGIGGLDKEFGDIFRRAFASRVFPQSVINELGIKHVKGMMLYGPPGTGKTLIARQIGKFLKAREPKIVNGPEVLSKYVGQAEENIRKLFQEAEEEYKKAGDNSGLHIIIFDEIDAICKQRGAGKADAGVGDSVVNQMLSKIDGVNALNNILVIGMTNRLDMIDEALLRPGRFEVHVEVGLADEAGRVQIFNIHTAKMRAANRLEPDVSIPELAARTKNFSGAEIEGLVRSATSWAFNRKVNVKDLAKPMDPRDMKITRADFELALNEIKPAFGVAEDMFESCLRNGVIPWGMEFEKLRSTMLTLAGQVKDSDNTPLLSILIEGPPGSGKTALAAHIAKVADFPFMKLITPENLISYGEAGKLSYINKTFEDAYKSNLSLIVLDDIERLLEFTPVGMRFSNAVLQGLMVLVKKVPPVPQGKNARRKLLVIGTTSNRDFLEATGLQASFNAHLTLPMVSSGEHLKAILGHRNAEKKDFPGSEIDKVAQSMIKPIGIKHLLIVTEMAAEFSRPGPIRAEAFMRCLRDTGFM
eukprot:GDKI01015104.1.p1 GENE.GDKI01015104.1~~GDKI01015104.1.p1  ORF type:complete len:761 (-),score=260.52 GDKI01015104.1:286-2568(-)